MADADALHVNRLDTPPNASEGATPEVEVEADVVAEGAEAAEAAEAGVPVVAEVDAEPKKRCAKCKCPRPIPIPKDSATFFRARAKNPKLFGFTADGNLQVPEMRGQAAKVIEIPYYRPSLPEEIAEEEAKRHDELVSVEKEYDEVLQQLKEAN
jgi:hypothetical protein